MSWRFKRTNLLFPLIVSFAVAFVTRAKADILHVPGDYPTIQEAIDAAVDGDEVEVHPGTYRELINFLGKSITVRSSDGPEVTIINGDLDDDGFGNGTVVTCSSAEGPDSVLEGFTITGGDDCSGGGMRNAGSSPTVMNCTFTDNWAISGGGMFNELGSHPTVKSCTFSGNTAIDSGSAMVNIDDSNPTVTDCTFSGNVGQGFFGGAMLNSGSNPVVTNCTFSGNLAGGFGGGGMDNLSSSPTITSCTFSGNVAERGAGGGMYNEDSSPTVTDCKFRGNTAFSGGGGMINLGGSPMVGNCTFTGNSAFYGGGMYNVNSSPTVTNCTISENTADSGGGMANSFSSPTVNNSISWSNTGGEIVDDDDSVTTVRYSDVQGGYAGIGNIDADPLFVDPDNGDYHLSPGSPCIDAADNTAVPKGIDTDLDGNPRFVDDPDTRDTGFGDPPIVDMGAYEFQATACPWDLDKNGSIGASDLLALLASWGPCKGCPADFDGNGTVGASDLLALLANWGPCP